MDNDSHPNSLAPSIFPCSTESVNVGHDDIIQHLDLSIPGLLETADDPSFWDMDDILNDEPPSSNTMAASEFVSDRNAPSSSTALIATSDTLCCSGCSILRQVVHSNGNQSMKLSIHGGPGVFCHAKIDVWDNSGGLHDEPHRINLRDRTVDQVKQFLVKYGMLRMQDKYYLIEDSFTPFYEALCVRLIDETTSTSNAVRSLPEQGLCEFRPPDQIIIPEARIAAQRERTGKMNLSELTEFFHLPTAKASQELKLCPTAIKKICRKYGIRRWPYRRVGNGQDVSQIMRKINALKEEKAEIYGGH